MEQDHFDVIIFGSGPAGLQAAIHAARRKVSVLVLGRLPKSSLYRAHIENFCCIEGEAGADLLRQARAKAEESGAEFLEEDVTELAKEDDHFVVKVESSRILRAKALIFAMGISRNKLGLKGEKTFLGRGVSYCVDCDAGFYKGESVAVIGNGSAAVTGALTLLFYAKEVHLVCETLEVADYLAEKLQESGIRIHEGRKVREIVGNESAEGLLLDDGTSIEASGIFIELGAKGAIDLAAYLGVAPDSETM